MVKNRNRVVSSMVDWNPFWKDDKIPDTLLGRKRSHNFPLNEILNRKEIKTLTGIRRCGKSTIIYQIINEEIRKGIKPENVLMINFDDKALSDMELSDLIEIYREEIGPGEVINLYLDEVHNCSDWVNTLRKMYDLAQLGQVFVTDSSSSYISGEYTTLISGRTINIKLHTLSFNEYIYWNKIDPKGPFNTEEIPIIKRNLKAYMKWGGYPEVVLAESDLQRKIILKDYLDTIIYKDIVERYNADQERLKILVGYLLSNPGSLFSPRKFSRRHNFSLETISKYLGYMKEVNFIHTVAGFDFSYNKILKSRKKVYIEDTGLSESFGFKFSEGKGKLMENVVFNEINRWDFDIYYWSDSNSECDFVLKRGQDIVLAIQVCHDLNEDNIKREMEGIDNCFSELNPENGMFITEHESDLDTGNYQKVELWRFLLDPNSYLRL